MNTKFVLRRSVVVLAIAFALGSSALSQEHSRPNPQTHGWAALSISHCNATRPSLVILDQKRGPMSQDWITKYGPRRVRRDPPTLDEAIFAAIGITDDQQQQAEIAAALMRLPFDEVLAEVKKQSRANARATTRVIAGEQGAQRSVVVERRVVQRFGNDKRTGT